MGKEVKGNSRIPLVKYLVRQWDGKVNGAFRYLYVNFYVSKKKKKDGSNFCANKDSFLTNV